MRHMAAAASEVAEVHKCKSKNINHAATTQQKHATLHTVVDGCVHMGRWHALLNVCADSIRGHEGWG